MREKAIIYCRLSSRKQLIDDNTLSEQEEMCRQWAKKEEVDIEDVCQDNESGDVKQRLGLSKLVAVIDSNVLNLKYVIIPNAKRLARGAEVGSYLVNIFRDHQIELVDLQKPDLRGEDSYGNFLLEAAKAKLEKDHISKQTSDAVQKKIEGGYAFGRIPKGYKLCYKEGEAYLVKDNVASKCIELMFKLAYEGLTVTEIRCEMYTKGCNKPAESTIRYRLKNKKYAGFLKDKNGNYFEGNIEPIVSKERFEKVQKLLQSRKRRKKRKKEIKSNKLLPLRKWLICSNCNKYFSGSRSYYNCPNCNINRKNELVHEKLRKFLNKFDLSLPFALGILTILYGYFPIFAYELTIILNEFKEDNKKITAKINNLNKKYLDIDNKNVSLQSECLKEQNKLEEMKIKNQEFINQFPFTMQIEKKRKLYKLASHNLGDIWLNKANGQIRELIKQIFPDGLKYDGESFKVNKDISHCGMNKVPGKSNIKRVDDYLQELFKDSYMKSEKKVEYKKEKNLRVQNILYHMAKRRCSKFLTGEFLKKVLKTLDKNYKGKKDEAISRLIKNIR